MLQTTGTCCGLSPRALQRMRRSTTPASRLIGRGETSPHVVRLRSDDPWISPRGTSRKRSAATSTRLRSRRIQSVHRKCS
jgi:hypothetical protein